MLQRIGQVIPQSGYSKDKRPDRVERTGGNHNGTAKHQDTANFSGGSVYLHSVGWSLVEMKMLPNDRLTALFVSSEYYFRLIIETKMAPSRFLLSVEQKVKKPEWERYVIMPMRVATAWAEKGENRHSEDYNVFKLFSVRVAEFSDALPGEKAVIHYIADLFGNLEDELETVTRNIAAIALTFLRKMDKISERNAGEVSPPVVWEDPLVEGLQAQ